MRSARSDVRDHIVLHKNDHAPYRPLASAAISKPIVVIVCMACSSQSWEPNRPISMALS